MMAPPAFQLLKSKTLGWSLSPFFSHISLWKSCWLRFQDTLVSLHTSSTILEQAIIVSDMNIPKTLEQFSSAPLCRDLQSETLKWTTVKKKKKKKAMFSIHWQQKTKAFRWSARVLHDLDLQPVPPKFLTSSPSTLSGHSANYPATLHFLHNALQSLPLGFFI